jgi:hypothetical protein
MSSYSVLLNCPTSAHERKNDDLFEKLNLDEKFRQNYKISNLVFLKNKIIISHDSDREVYKLLMLKHIENTLDCKIDKLSHQKYYIRYINKPYHFIFEIK